MVTEALKEAIAGAANANTNTKQKNKALLPLVPITAASHSKKFSKPISIAWVMLLKMSEQIALMHVIIQILQKQLLKVFKVANPVLE